MESVDLESSGQSLFLRVFHKFAEGNSEDTVYTESSTSNDQANLFDRFKSIGAPDFKNDIDATDQISNPAIIVCKTEPKSDDEIDESAAFRIDTSVKKVTIKTEELESSQISDQQPGQALRGQFTPPHDDDSLWCKLRSCAPYNSQDEEQSTGCIDNSSLPSSPQTDSKFGLVHVTHAHATWAASAAKSDVARGVAKSSGDAGAKGKIRRCRSRQSRDSKNNDAAENASNNNNKRKRIKFKFESIHSRKRKVLAKISSRGKTAVATSRDSSNDATETASPVKPLNAAATRFPAATRFSSAARLSLASPPPKIELMNEISSLDDVLLTWQAKIRLQQVCGFDATDNVAVDDVIFAAINRIKSLNKQVNMAKFLAHSVISHQKKLLQGFF